MTRNVGVVRNADGLRTALREIAALTAKQPTCESFQNICTAATMIAAAALLREESRGAHERSDFPETLPALAHRSRLTWDAARTLRDSLLEAPLPHPETP